MYILKPPLKINCFQCKKKVVINFMPPSQKYSNKNNWGYWTGKKEYQGKYACDTCLIDMYRHHKYNYLNSITDSKKRRTFRAYFGGKASLTRVQQQKQLANSEVHKVLRSKGIDLDKDGLGDYLESWRQAGLKVIEENARQAKKIKELEKKLAEKPRKPSAKPRN